MQLREGSLTALPAGPAASCSRGSELLDLGGCCSAEEEDEAVDCASIAWLSQSQLSIDSFSQSQLSISTTGEDIDEACWLTITVEY